MHCFEHPFGNCGWIEHVGQNFDFWVCQCSMSHVRLHPLHYPSSWEGGRLRLSRFAIVGQGSSDRERRSPGVGKRCDSEVQGQGTLGGRDLLYQIHRGGVVVACALYCVSPFRSIQYQCRIHLGTELYIYINKYIDNIVYFNESNLHKSLKRSQSIK